MSGHEHSLQTHSESLISIKRQESSLLSQYKRLSMGEESFYFAIDPISYAPLPKFIPKKIAKQYNHCICLENSSFYQMFTFAIFQHLLKKSNLRKMEQITKLKNLICSNNFFNFANYTKGLILKGLRIMVQNNGNFSSFKPAAQVLMGSEKMHAFSECWKQMIFYFNKKRNTKAQEINSSMIQIFTNFFEMEIHFYTKKGKDFELQIIRSKKHTQITGIITILLLSNTFDQLQQQNPGKQQTFSEISSIYGNWNYYILLNYPQIEIKEDKSSPPTPKKLPTTIITQMGIKKRQTITMDYPQLFAIDEDKKQYLKQNLQGSNFKSLIAHSRKIVHKGQTLVKSMRNFVQNIQIS